MTVIMNSKQLIGTIWVCAAVTSTPAFFCDTAFAQARPTQSRLDAAAIQGFYELLETTDITLVESDSHGRPWQVLILAVVEARPKRVFDVIADVSNYPKFLQSVSSSKVLKRNRGMELSSWALNVPVLGLKGKRAMRPQPPGVVEFRGVSGHFKQHRERWEIYPHSSPDRAIVAMYRSVDLKKNGGFLLKTLLTLEPSIEHGMYAAASFVQLEDLRRYLEKKPKAKPGKHKGPMPSFQEQLSSKKLQTLMPLLKRGEVSLIYSNDDGSFQQSTVLTIVNAPREKVIEIAHDADKYPEFVPNLERYKLEKSDKGYNVIDYEIDLPLMNIEGLMKMKIGAAHSVAMDALKGDIERGKWLWTFGGLNEETTIIAHYSYVDITKASWFISKLVEIQPLFEHGSVTALSMVQVRAIKERCEGKR